MMKSDFSKIIAKAKPVKRVKKAPYKVPKWFSRLPTGSHGSTPSQKKAWKVVSDYVREKDFILYGGKCVSCPRIIPTVQDGDAGHFKPWSNCHGMMKFYTKNIALQCQFCNRYRSGIEAGYYFGEALKRRHGENFIEEFETLNEQHRGKKIEEWELVEMVAKLRPDLVKD